jgi:hypothetical protein
MCPANQPVLYSTWGRRDGDAANPELFSTFNEMNRRTTQGYIEYASRLDEAMVVPAGRAFELIWEDSQGEEPPVTHADLYWSQVSGIIRSSLQDAHDAYTAYLTGRAVHINCVYIRRILQGGLCYVRVSGRRLAPEPARDVLDCLLVL